MPGGEGGTDSGPTAGLYYYSDGDDGKDKVDLQYTGFQVFCKNFPSRTAGGSTYYTGGGGSHCQGQGWKVAGDEAYL